MKLWQNILSLIVISLLVLPVNPARAALSFSDTLSTVIPETASNHQLSWTVNDAGGIAEGQSFVLEFATEFDTAAITSSDIDISDDGTDLTLAADCSGGEKASFINNGDDTFSLSICPGDGGAVGTGSAIVVKIGTNAAGGSHQIINPQAGNWRVTIFGSGGYDDQERTDVVIINGTSVSATWTPNGDLRIIGYASPGATVYFLETGSVIGTQVATAGSVFDKTLSALTPGIHLISIYATDTGARNTLTITFSVNVIGGGTTIVSGIILPPTISLSAPSVKRPAMLPALGSAKNNASVMVFITGSGDNQTQSLGTDANGGWSTNVNPKLHLGGKQAYSIALDGFGGMSEVSQTRLYDVLLSADLNVDNLINLTDFSVLMYNYGTSSPPNVVADINDNGPVDLVDFSVMMYYWTGG